MMFRVGHICVGIFVQPHWLENMRHRTDTDCVQGLGVWLGCVHGHARAPSGTGALHDD